MVTPFILLRGDDVKFGVWCGECRVTILGHSFTCDFDFGEWSAGSDEDSWLLEDEEFMDAIESADGVISGQQADVEAQQMVYCRANNIKEEIPAYWWEDDEKPKDVGGWYWYDRFPGKVSVILSNGEKKEVECDLECDSVYNLYCRLKENGLLYKSPVVTSDYIKNEESDLYSEIVEALKSNGIHNNDLDEIDFTLENTEDFFESILG